MYNHLWVSQVQISFTCILKTQVMTFTVIFCSMFQLAFLTITLYLTTLAALEVTMLAADGHCHLIGEHRFPGRGKQDLPCWGLWWAWLWLENRMRVFAESWWTVEEGCLLPVTHPSPPCHLSFYLSPCFLSFRVPYPMILILFLPSTLKKYFGLPIIQVASVYKPHLYALSFPYFIIILQGYNTDE